MQRHTWNDDLFSGIFNSLHQTCTPCRSTLHVRFSLPATEIRRADTLKRRPVVASSPFFFLGSGVGPYRTNRPRAIAKPMPAYIATFSTSMTLNDQPLLSRISCVAVYCNTRSNLCKAGVPWSVISCVANELQCLKFLLERSKGIEPPIGYAIRVIHEKFVPHRTLPQLFRESVPITVHLIFLLRGDTRGCDMRSSRRVQRGIIEICFCPSTNCRGCAARTRNRSPRSRCSRDKERA